MKIMIVGAGGVGGYVAGRLCRGGAEVTVIARGANLDAIQKNGLTIVDGEKSFTVHPAATQDPAMAGGQDAIFICTKGYGLDAALEQIRPAVRPGTMVIPLLNGVNIYKRVQQALPEALALSGSIYIYANIVSPGVVSKNGPLLRLEVGVPGRPAADAPPALHELVALLNKSGLPTELSDDIVRENWIKWAILVSNGQSNAYFGAPLGAIRDDPERMEFVLSLLREVLALAEAEGISMPADMEDRLATTMKNLPYDSVSSLARDIAEPGKSTELSLFAGEVCRLADAHGIDVPANRSMLEKFKDRL